MSALLAESGLEALCLEYLDDLGWTILHGPDIAPDGTMPERSSYADVLLEGRLREAVERLNPDLPEAAVDEVIKSVARAESQVLLTENWRVYRLLTHGVPVEYRDPAGRVVHGRARLIDWDCPGNNDFVAVNQFTVIQDRRNRRADVVHFVNGLGLALQELKAPGSPNATLRGAHNQLKTYARDISSIFLANAVCVISDGVQARMGTFTAGWEHYAPWKTVDGATVAPGEMPQIEVLIRGVFDKSRFLDLVRSFVVFSGDGGAVTDKKVAKYHQFWAVNAAVDRTLEAATVGDGRAGVVWHTQGSGKSLEMLFYSNKIMGHPIMANPTLVLLTDRNDLDDQLFDEVFAPARTLAETPVQAESREHLKTLLTRNSGGIIFTTVQKFGLSKDDRDAGRPFPLLSDRKNIVVIADEAHRSQYDFIDGLARNLRDGLPNASFIGFTGTPIESKDKNTKQVFGDYIDIYDLTQAVADEATVKVFYEARLAKVEVPQEALDLIDDQFEEATEGTEDEVKARLKTRWARVEAIVGSEKRVKELAADVVAHWGQRTSVLAGKGLIVCMSRRIAANLYNEIIRLRPDWHSDEDAEGKIKVVVTGSAADEELLQPHIRNKERLRALKGRAKDPNDPLELVIVRDMWLTGFDSPSMHTMYVDKPMRGAGLMQAIARVNRTFRDKPSGLVVDYIGIADDLQEALADYTQRDQKSGEVGQSVEEQAVPRVIEKHEVVCNILHAYDWRTLLEGGDDKAFLNAISGTTNYLFSDEDLKQRFMDQTRYLVAFFTMSVPNPTAMQFRDDVAFFQAVRSMIGKIEGTDREGGDPNAELDTAIKQVVSDAIVGGGVIDIYAEAGLENPDLSLIDDDFVEKVRKSPQPNLQIEMLRRLLNEEIRSVGKRNIVADKRFSEMLQRSLNAYRNRSIDAAEVVAQLVMLANELKDEHDRGKVLGLNDSELAFYDAVRTNDAAVLELGDDTLKAIARDLVLTVRKNATIDWDAKDTVRARLRAHVKRLLTRYKYPPDKRESATALVLQQAELIAADWAVEASGRR